MATNAKPAKHSNSLRSHDCRIDSNRSFQKWLSGDEEEVSNVKYSWYMFDNVSKKHLKWLKSPETVRATLNVKWKDNFFAASFWWRDCRRLFSWVSNLTFKFIQLVSLFVFQILLVRSCLRISISKFYANTPENNSNLTFAAIRVLKSA